LNHNNKVEQEQAVKNNRDLIYQYIQRYPGSHLRKISKELSLGMGDIQHHLCVLENAGLIKSRRISIYKVYYEVSVFEERNESILAILRQETPRSILLYLIENPSASQGEIATHIGYSAPTVSWHMSRLIQIGLVESRKDGRFVKYVIVGNLKEITQLLRSYYPTIWSKLSNRLADLFLDISPASISSPKGEDYFE
jgi:predicted transcriptional regulator